MPPDGRSDVTAGHPAGSAVRARRSTSSSLLGRVRRLVPKLTRYAGVSAVSTTVTLTILTLLVHSGRVPPGWANVVATGAGTVPSFELNRRWVWRKPGRRSVSREVLPFCALSLAELGLSTLAVSLADGWARRSGLGHDAMAAVAALANVTTYGSLWVAQYVVLEKFLFAGRGAPRHPDGGPHRSPDDLRHPDVDHDDPNRPLATRTHPHPGAPGTGGPEAGPAPAWHVTADGPTGSFPRPTEGPGLPCGPCHSAPSRVPSKSVTTSPAS